MTGKEFLKYGTKFPGTQADCPFSETDAQVLRHVENRKWFALLFRLDGKECANVKCDPAAASFWRGLYQGIKPAWHMNKEHWIMVELESDVPPEDIWSMLYTSYQLTAKRKKG